MDKEQSIRMVIEILSTRDSHGINNIDFEVLGKTVMNIMLSTKEISRKDLPSYISGVSFTDETFIKFSKELQSK